MTHGLERLAKAARAGAIPGGVIRDGGLTSTGSPPTLQKALTS